MEAPAVIIAMEAYVPAQLPRLCTGLSQGLASSISPSVSDLGAASLQLKACEHPHPASPSPHRLPSAPLRFQQLLGTRHWWPVGRVANPSRRSPSLPRSSRWSHLWAPSSDSGSDCLKLVPAFPSHFPGCCCPFPGHGFISMLPTHPQPPELRPRQS